MLHNFQIVLFITIISSSAYWLVPRTSAWLRRGILLLASILLIFVYSPKALLLATLITILAYGLLIIARWMPQRKWGYRLLWIIFIPMIIGIWIPQEKIFSFIANNPRGPIIEAPAFLGLSFYTIKLFGSLKESLKQGTRCFWGMLTCVLFFPSFSAGPIDSASTFEKKYLSQKVDTLLFFRGFLRIGVGAVKLLVISEIIYTKIIPYMTGLNLSENIVWSQVSMGNAYLFALLKFVGLYFNFAGYTDIAIGSGWLFNIRLSENFRFPLFAYNIQNFWQRWHLSLANFITKQLFLPMVRVTGKPVFSIVTAFTLIGLWHQATLNYFFWGVGHGTAMGLYMVVMGERRKEKKEFTVKLIFIRFFGVVCTLSFVSVLSVFANLPNFSNGIEFLSALFGLTIFLPS